MALTVPPVLCEAAGEGLDDLAAVAIQRQPSPASVPWHYHDAWEAAA